jgi:hypothetical protein
MPGRFHTASTLARLLKRRQAFPITAHSIEQTICGLRKKLGESGPDPRLLRNRRGLGYGLFLPNGIPSLTALEASSRRDSRSQLTGANGC